MCMCFLSQVSSCFLSASRKYTLLEPFTYVKHCYFLFIVFVSYSCNIIITVIVEAFSLSALSISVLYGAYEGATSGDKIKYIFFQNSLQLSGLRYLHCMSTLINIDASISLSLSKLSKLSDSSLILDFTTDNRI